MLSIQVNRNHPIQVSFDITGGGENVIGYYIREVKVKLKTSYWNNRQEQMELLRNVHYEIPYCSSAFTESRNERILTLTLKKLIGFYKLASFQPAIEEQYNEILKGLRYVINEEEEPVQFEMVLDVIY